MSVTLADLVHWCDQTLMPQQFKDYCPNGLQVEGRAEVSHLVTGVTASLALIEQAIEQRADAILVHHGYFWKGENSVLTGMKGQRIRRLMQHDIALIAYHLPLDAHPTLGNNIAFAETLGFITEGALDRSQAQPIGNIGRCAPMTAAQMQAHVGQQLGHIPLHLSGGQPNKIIRRVGWCTGGAQDYLSLAAEQGCDAYFSGEVSERTVHEAAELGIDYFACGHHASERGGVQRLGAALAQQFAIQSTFIDLFTPV